MSEHNHTVVCPLGSRFYCLTCGQKLSAREAWAAMGEIIDDYALIDVEHEEPACIEPVRTTIYEHFLFYSSRKAATTAYYEVHRLLRVNRYKVTEYENRPVVLLQTDMRLGSISCAHLTRLLLPIETIFNRVVGPHDIDQVQIPFPGVDWPLYYLFKHGVPS